MSVTISPPMFLQFFIPGTGQPAIGYQLFTYIGGTSTKQATWTDSTQSVQNKNPIILDSQGSASVWLDPSLIYKFVWTTPNDTDPPASPIKTQDGITIGLIFPVDSANIHYDITPAEIAASVSPVNFFVKPGNVLRYGTNTIPGTTDTTAAINSAVKQGIQNGGNLIYFPGVNGGSGVTANDYAVASGPIDIGGAVMLKGETDRLSFKGPRVIQTSNATGTAANGSLFTVTAASPIAISFESLGLAYSGATALAGAALFYLNPSGGGPNSFYFRNVWFFEPMYYALNLNGADDVQVLGCTFDVTAQRFFGIGGQSAGKMTNVGFVANTFYLGAVQSSAVGEIVAVDNFVFSNNRVYADSTHQCPIGLNAGASFATAVANLVITDNTWEFINVVVELCSAVTQSLIASNIITNVSGAPAIAGGGGAPISGAVITDNVIKGYSPYPFGLIDFTGTPLTNSVIANNSILCQNGATVATTATNASPCVFTGAIPGAANGMPVVLGGTAPTGFTAGTIYFMVTVIGNTYELAATQGGAAINSSSTGAGVTAAPMTPYGVNLPGSPNTGNVIGPNAISGYAISAYNISTWQGQLGSVGPLGAALTLTGVSGTPTVGARYSISGNSCTLEVPAANAAASGTAVTLTNLPAAIQPAQSQSFPVVVLNNSVNTFGIITIGPSSTITLGVGAAGAAFAGTGNQGISTMTITYPLS